MAENVDAGVPLNRPAFLSISNGTEQTAHVTITRYNGTNPSLVINTVIAPGSLYKFDYTTDADMKTIENPRGLAGSVTEFGIHIQSDIKVTAYHMHYHTNSRDIFTIKGRQALGTLFYVPMQSDNAAPTNTSLSSYDQVDIVATEDDTEVAVAPTAAIVNTSEIGPNPFPAGDTLRRTLNKGQTLKIMEQNRNSGSLTGTYITSTRPVAVTVTEDLTVGNGSDAAGDQIVPVTSLGSRYIVPRGYKTTSPPDRFYLVSTEVDTEVKIYQAATNESTTISLNVAGAAARYDFPTNVNAVYVEANNPVYIYQRTGFNEEGAALLSSLYAIGQKQLSYFQVTATNQRGIIVFKTGKESGFRISYGSVNNGTLDVGTPVEIPAISDWQIGRFILPTAANNQIVTIRNEQSPFSLGYIAANSGSTSYGYLSSFNFEFPDTTYMCTTDPSVTLEGSYAMSYEWSYNGTPFATTQNVTVTDPGAYTLEMNQDPKIVTLTTYVSRVSVGTICSDTLICPSTSPTLSVSGASGDRFQWQTRSGVNAAWTDIPGATLPTYTPAPLYQPAYYRRGTTANRCEMLYSESMEVQISRPCVLPVNPHLMIRYE